MSDRKTSAISQDITRLVPSAPESAAPHRRSAYDPSQPLMVPSSPQTMHSQRIAGGSSLRRIPIWPGHGFRPGRRVHPILLTHDCPGSAAVPALTIAPRCRAIRRAGAGASSGTPRKWRRSETNTPQGYVPPRRTPDNHDHRPNGNHRWPRIARRVRAGCAVLRYGQGGDGRRSGALFGARSGVLDRRFEDGRRRPPLRLPNADLCALQSPAALRALSCCCARNNTFGIGGGADPDLE